MEIVSGRTGKPHVTSQQFRQIIEGIIGDDSCILPSGENLEPELVSNNSLKIRSGMMCHHGNVSSVKIGTYDEVELTNGSQGMKRIDLIVNRYTRNEKDNTEKNEWVVIMGSPAESNPVVPEYTQGDLQKGDLVDDCPAFEVHLDGINIVEVTKKLEIATTNKELAAKLPVYGTTPIIETRANSYKDTSVKFGKTFSKAPVVVISLSGGSQNTKSFGVQVLSTTASSFVVRTVNGNNSSLTIMVNWCAFPKGA